MTFYKHSTKLNAVAFLFTALLLLLAAYLLSPFSFVPSAPSAVNDVATSCVVPASPFFDRKACPLEEEISKMLDYHYGVALETTTSLPISWMSIISSFLHHHHHHHRAATSAAWLLDMQIMLSWFSLSTTTDVIENIGRCGWCWFNFLKVNFAEYADYFSAAMMASIDHALGVLQEASHELYSALTSYYYDISAWTLHLPTVILRDIPTALCGKSSVLLRSFQSSDAVVLTSPGSLPTPSSAQPYLIDLLINSTGPVTTAAAPINVTPTTVDSRETLCVASGWVGVDKSVLVSSPRVLHPPMFTIFLTLDPAMARGGRKYTLVVNIDLVVLAIALLSMMAVRVVFNRVVEGFKSNFLHLTYWNGASHCFESIPFELFDSAASSACHKSCEELSSSSLGSALSEAMMSSTQTAPFDSIPLELFDLAASFACHESCESSSSSLSSASGETLMSSTQTAPHFTSSSLQPVSSEAASSNLSAFMNTTTVDPFVKLICKLRWRRMLHELQMQYMVFPTPNSDESNGSLPQSSGEAGLSESSLSLGSTSGKAMSTEEGAPHPTSSSLQSVSSDSFANLSPVSASDVTANNYTTKMTQEAIPGTTITAAGQQTDKDHDRVIREVQGRQTLGRVRKARFLRNLGEDVPTAGLDDQTLLDSDLLYWMFFFEKRHEVVPFAKRLMDITVKDDLQATSAC